MNRGWQSAQNNEDEKIISQIVGISRDCDENGGRVSKNDNNFNICIKRLKGVLVKYEKYGTVSIHAHPFDGPLPQVLCNF